MGRRTEERANFADQGDFFGEFLTMGVDFCGSASQRVGGSARLPRRVSLETVRLVGELAGLGIEQR